MGQLNNDVRVSSAERWNDIGRAYTLELFDHGGDGFIESENGLFLFQGNTSDFSVEVLGSPGLDAMYDNQTATGKPQPIVVIGGLIRSMTPGRRQQQLRVEMMGRRPAGEKTIAFRLGRDALSKITFLEAPKDTLRAHYQRHMSDGGRKLILDAIQKS